MVGVPLAKIGQRVGGVAGLGHAELNIARPQVVVVLDRQFYHPQPVVFVEQISSFFERILRRHHKPHLLQVRLLPHHIRDNEMSEMDRIKRTEKKADVHGPKVIKSAITPVAVAR